jgi:hypothetical protein
MCLAIRNDQWRLRSDTWLLCDRLSLVAIIVGRLAGRIWWTVRLGRVLELSRKLLLNMWVVDGG